MRLKTVFAAAIFTQMTIIGASASATGVMISGGGTVIVNGHVCRGNMVDNKCYGPCQGSLRISNGHATCNGVEMTPSDGSDAFSNDRDICGSGANVREHINGGGLVEDTAQVEDSVKVEKGSAVCALAIVTGPVAILGRSVISGSAKISGRTTLDATEVSGAVSVADSVLTSSQVSGAAFLNQAKVTSSQVSASSRVIGSNVVSSQISGRAGVLGSNIVSSQVSGSAQISGENLVSEQRQ